MSEVTVQKNNVTKSKMTLSCQWSAVKKYKRLDQWSCQASQVHSSIHSKIWFWWLPKTASYFGFSAKRFLSNYVQSYCLNPSYKKDMRLAYSQKMPFWFKKLQILVTYVLLTLNFLVKIYAFFQQSFWAWKAESANIFAGTNCQEVQDCWYR